MIEGFFNEYSIPLFGASAILGLYLCGEKLFYYCKRRKRTNVVTSSNENRRMNNKRNPILVCVDESNKEDNIKNAVKALTSRNTNNIDLDKVVKANKLYKIYFPPKNIRK